MKTAYIITPGVQLPDNFQWRGAPLILSQPGLWEIMRGLASGLVFRVRTDSSVGDKLTASDRIESCIGLIDTTSRWRACLGVIRTTLTGLRIREVAEPCWAVFSMMTGKHPASVSMQERQQLAGDLRVAIEALPGDDPRAAFESSVAAMCVRLAFCENDIEVAHVVPYVPIYMTNAGEYAEDREATVEALASSMFLCEAFGRMSEKTPEWLFGALPAVPGVAVAPPDDSKKPVKAQVEVSAEDEGL